MEQINQNAYGSGSDGIWRCPECETINSAERCCICGCSRPGIQKGKRCICGYRNGEKAKFCAGCGRRLSSIDWKRVIPGAVLTTVAIVLAAMLLFGKEESHTHDWETGTCTTPKTCRTCGEMTGTAVGHQWESATCTTPKTCKTCGETTGAAVGHQWESATCTTPKTCKICRKTTGSPTGHQWELTTDTRSEICKVCSETRKRVFKEPEEPKYKVGDVVSFGHYEQDKDSGNGAEPVLWYVLDVEENAILLLSVYALDSLPFHKGGGKVTWEQSTIRKWLNSTFLDALFTEAEQRSVLTASVNNSAEHGNSKWNPINKAFTEDKIYLLSYAELELYMPDPKDRICTPTEYAVKRKESVITLDDGKKAGFWWLRSPGDRSKCAAYVNFRGECFSNDMANDYLSVRPAVWVYVS